RAHVNHKLHNVGDRVVHRQLRRWMTRRADRSTWSRITGPTRRAPRCEWHERSPASGRGAAFGVPDVEWRHGRAVAVTFQERGQVDDNHDLRASPTRRAPSFETLDREPEEHFRVDERIPRVRIEARIQASR